MESNAKEAKDRRTAQAKQRARWNSENHSRNRFLRALWDLASCETPVRSPHLDPEGWLRWTYDTGFAISAFPLDARIGTETQANECSYTTASGELISDRGGMRLQGMTEYRYEVTHQDRKANVPKNSDEREQGSQ